MPGKRKLVQYDDDYEGNDDNDAGYRDATAIQNPVVGSQMKRRRTSLLLDNTAALSDELLIRIFSFLDEKTLLTLSPVSHRFNRVTSDSQLWRPHYYLRFILPRAHRIPGFRAGSTRSSSKLHYSTGKSIWADGGWGRRGGFVGTSTEPSAGHQEESIDWKKQYRLRHNWARGHCAVDEVPVRHAEHNALVPVTDWQTLVKVVDGLAVTVDAASGLRAWHLKTRRLVAQTALSRQKDLSCQPTCLAVDDVLLTSLRVLDIAVGFEDGSFEIWRLDVKRAKISLCYRHVKSYYGELLAITYAHPYLLTASRLGFISLFSFSITDVAAAAATANSSTTTATQLDLDAETISDSRQEPDPSPSNEPCDDKKQEKRKGVSIGSIALTRPRLLTCLKSHSTRPPLALSIRRTTASVIASIAYTFDAIGGWSIGIQDFDIKSSGTRKSDVVTSRVAYTLPTRTRRSATSSTFSSSYFSSSSSPSPPFNRTRPSPRPPSRPLEKDHEHEHDHDHDLDPSHEDGPIRLCYSHPYLLATLPDNTLILHLCTSTTSSLSISPGIRLWGHTSGISDAEITPRGKAVSVSTHGHEIRVWELEGRVGGSSVELRPRSSTSEPPAPPWESTSADPEDRKNWVGFDDEMVVVLKGGRDGRESLMVYDFT
ncbi:hypothetical protein E4U55_001866 [Claviceps digitariae]|nr:hypothetical protein E4U55_001866 [Claviceps digitariae]